MTSTAVVPVLTLKVYDRQRDLTTLTSNKLLKTIELTLAVTVVPLYRKSITAHVMPL